MMRFVQLATIVGVFALLASVALAHGGQYSGPAGGGSSGGFAPAGAGTPGPGPGPAGGGTGSPGGTTGPVGSGTTGPGAPTPGSPGSPPGGTPAPGGTGTGVPGSGATPGGYRKPATDANLTWAAWWFFNDDKYLNLKAKIRSEENETDNADLFAGNAFGGDEVTKVNAKMIREQVNPILKLALKDPFFDTRAAALIALGKAGMPESLADLKTLMNDEHKQVRESSFLAMGILGNKEAIPTLVATMNDTTEARKWVDQTNGIDTRTRAFAALGIGLIGARENDLSDTQAVSALVDMMNAKENEKQRDLQIAPIVALGIMKAKEAVPALIKFFDDKSNQAWARAYAATSLAKIGDPAALDPITKGLKDKQNAVVQSCAMALGVLAKPEDKDAVDGLQKLTKSGADLGAKNFAIMSLAEIGGEENRNFIAKMTKKGNIFERSFSALGMGIYYYQNPNDATKGEICEDLHKFFKAEKNPDIRGANAIALGLMAYEPAGADILETLKDGGQASLRSHLCIALGLMRYTAATPEIRRTVSDKGDIDLRRSASIALGLMGDKEAVAVLQKEIEASENSLAVHGAVTQGLGFIGDRSAVPTLIKFLRERDKYQDSTRAFAAVALGLLGDKDDIPIISKISEHNNYLIRTDAIGEVLTIL
ncbi:MAG: HEAT repeat domain-containing protein [Planctomycetes bacterium]|nr:HEAT repeat domain-containing protein [Planctomycetota bacterium]